MSKYHKKKRAGGREKEENKTVEKEKVESKDVVSVKNGTPQ
jgi:hypothetical protein